MNDQDLSMNSRGMICARCDKPTGNNNQGHCGTYCKVTRTLRELHFCCPDDCELQATGTAA